MKASVAANTTVDSLAKLHNDAHSVWNRFYTALFKQAVSIWPQVLTGLVVLVLFIIFGLITAMAIRSFAKRVKRRQAIYYLLARVVKIVIYIFGVVTALGTMGVDVTALVAGVGLSGFAIGLALKDPISNAISGFMVLFYEPFVVGDTISLTNAEGTVKAIELRYTKLKTDDDKTVLIPNANLLTNVLTVEHLKKSSKAE